MKEGRVAVRSKVGLHARPAGRFVEEALKHKCKVSVELDGRTADGKSIIMLLTLGATQGQVMTVRTEGEGESEALRDLVSLLQNAPE